MKAYSEIQLIEALRKKNYQIFMSDAKNYNLNIVGIRSTENIPNVFNDLLCVFWVFGKHWTLRQWAITTDPGTYWLENPMNVNGCAILKPGQYLGMWEIGKHNGYEALVQVNPCTVFRDYDLDGKIDYNSRRQETGVFGIDLHRSFLHGRAQFVDKFSAGCQVFQEGDDYAQCMNLCRLARQNYGNHFSYTLLKEKDIV